MPGRDDRFGMPDEAFANAKASHGAANPVHRIGMYVPTRGEVAFMPEQDLSMILDCWMWETPAELIPSVEQIREIRVVLSRRPDAGRPEIGALISVCDDFLTRTGSGLEQKSESERNAR